MMLLTCRRESSATTQPRAGVRVNPAESAAEVSMQSSLYRADAACQASRKSPTGHSVARCAIRPTNYGFFINTINSMIYRSIPCGKAQFCGFYCPKFGKKACPNEVR